MKQALQLWARANQAHDARLLGLLETLGNDGYVQERNTFFKSVAGLHQHVLQTYKFYQALIRTNTKQKYLVSPFTEDSFEVKPVTLAETADFYRTYNALWVGFADAVDPLDLDTLRFHRTMRNGKVYDLSIGEVVMQYMNHAAHHRGQLSQLLDELGLEHDVGGILAFGKEVV